MHKSRANTTFLFSSLSPKTNPLSPSTFPSVSPSTWWFHTVLLTPKYCTASMISSVCQLYSRQADITGWRGRSGANSEHTSHENTHRHKHANTHTCMDEYKGKYEETWIICETRAHICLWLTCNVLKALCYTAGSTGSLFLCHNRRANTHTWTNTRAFTKYMTKCKETLWEVIPHMTDATILCAGRSLSHTRRHKLFFAQHLHSYRHTHIHTHTHWCSLTCTCMKEPR